MSDIQNWSTTAAANNDAPPDGFPEGMEKSDVNDAAREVMAAVRTWYDDPEWLDLFVDYTVTRDSATEVRIAGLDAVTAGYVPTDRRIQIVGATTETGYIVSATYTSPDTVVTVNLDGAATVPTAVTQILLYAMKSVSQGAFTTGIDIFEVEAFL